MITDEKDILTREVDPKGETVWKLHPTDLPEKYRFINTQSCTRLVNGNTIICSRGNNGKGPQLVEVTPDKKMRVCLLCLLWSILQISCIILFYSGLAKLPSFVMGGRYANEKLSSYFLYNTSVPCLARQAGFAR